MTTIGGNWIARSSRAMTIDQRETSPLTRAFGATSPHWGEVIIGCSAKCARNHDIIELTACANRLKRRELAYGENCDFLSARGFGLDHRPHLRPAEKSLRGRDGSRCQRGAGRVPRLRFRRRSASTSATTSNACSIVATCCSPSSAPTGWGTTARARRGSAMPTIGCASRSRRRSRRTSP